MRLQVDLPQEILVKREKLKHINFFPLLVVFDDLTRREKNYTLNVVYQ